VIGGWAAVPPPRANPGGVLMTKHMMKAMRVFASAAHFAGLGVGGGNAHFRMNVDQATNLTCVSFGMLLQQHLEASSLNRPCSARAVFSSSSAAASPPATLPLSPLLVLVLVLVHFRSTSATAPPTPASAAAVRCANFRCVALATRPRPRPRPHRPPPRPQQRRGRRPPCSPWPRPLPSNTPPSP